MEKKRTSLFPLGVYAFSACAALLFFAPSFHNFFAYDDFRYIENLFHGPLQVLLGYNMIRIVSNLVWVPLYMLSGYDPFGYNLFNAFIFSLNPLILFFVLRELTDRTDVAVAGSAVLASTGVACDVFFWKMSLSTLLQASFYLLTLFAYIRFRKAGKRSWYSLSLLFFLLGMFTKEDAASLPFIVFLLEGLFLDGLVEGKRKATITRILPYVGIVIFYVTTSHLVFRLLNLPSETAKFFKFRPLYSLFAGYGQFFLDPSGVLSLDNPAIYITAALLLAGVFLIRDHRRLYIFALLWIPLTFLPPSLSSIGQFEPKYIFNSISRLLYLPTVGGAIAIAAALLEIRSRFTTKAFATALAAFLATSLTVNASRVHARGERWRGEAAPVRVFLEEIKQVMPQFPPHAYVFVLDPPTGRAYVQQALRGAYRNPDITWIVDPVTYHPKDGEKAFLISCYWGNGGVRIRIEDFETGIAPLR